MQSDEIAPFAALVVAVMFSAFVGYSLYVAAEPVQAAAPSRFELIDPNYFVYKVQSGGNCVYTKQNAIAVVPVGPGGC